MRLRKHKKTSFYTPLSMALAALLLFPGNVAWADPARDLDAEQVVEVTVAESIEDAMRLSETPEDAEAFFAIDPERVEEAPVQEPVLDELLAATEGATTKTESEAAVLSVLEESELYEATVQGDEIVVTSTFANKRLRLMAEEESEINAFGACSAMYYKDHYLLSYETEEQAATAFAELKAIYGENAVFIDYPIMLEETGDINWGATYMNLPDTGADIAQMAIVAVIDSGLQASHPALQGVPVVKPFNALDGTQNVQDTKGHGTSVSHVIAEAAGNRAAIMPVKVVDMRKTGSMEDVLNAVEYAHQNGADVINMSLVSLVSDPEYIAFLESQFAAYPEVIVCASGNQSADITESGAVPAALSSTIAVGSIGTTEQRSSFSNYGEALDFCAPGEGLHLATKGSVYSTTNGTSFATPYISAAAATLLSKNPGISKQAVKETLIGLSKDLASPGFDTETGHGCPVFNTQEDQTEEPLPELQKTSIEGAQITGVSASYAYTGSPIAPSFEIRLGDKTLTDGTDYDWTIRNNTAPGTATLTITGKNEYEGTVEITFHINKKDIGKAGISMQTSHVYTGNPITPSLNVTHEGKALKAGTDYTATYKNNTNAGTATIEITGKGVYAGSVKKTFQIKRKPVSQLSVAQISAKTYTGSVQRPAVTIKHGAKTLKAGTDYAVSYAANTNAGTARITITGKGNYEGSVTKTFQIAKKSLAGMSITGISANYTYQAKAIRPTPTVKWGSRTLRNGTDYTVSYSANTNVGTATVKITGKGNYAGTISRTFRILPKTSAIFSLRAEKKAFTATWSRQSTQTTGYQLQYSTDKAFKKNVKTITIGNTKTNTRKITGLKANTTYYVRVRTYKTIGKTGYYAPWSAAKTVKAKA